MVRRQSLVLLLLGMLGMLPMLFRHVSLNRVAVIGAQTIARSSAEATMRADFASLSVTGACRRYWFRGLLAKLDGDVGGRNSEWREAIRCSPEHAILASLILPNDKALAQQAIQLQPGSADAWFWLARIRQQETPTEAINLFRRGLSLRPDAALAWRELGDLLRRHDPQAAKDAYLQSCLNGDPGFHGCLEAGRMAEQEGDTLAALQYYQLSHFPEARERGAQLEQRMQQSR